MTLDDLPDQFEQFVSRARSAIDQQITKAKNVVDAANAEKTAAANALIDLQAQCKSAQDQLELNRRELQRSAALLGVGHDIAKARTELARVKRETVEAIKALELLQKQRTEREAQIVALGNEAQRLIAIRTEGEMVMANIRAQLNSVQIGART